LNFIGSRRSTTLEGQDSIYNVVEVASILDHVDASN
jgi:hypothetical protein